MFLRSCFGRGLSALAFCAALMAAGPADAQLGPGVGIIDLSESDIEMAKAAAAPLYENPDSVVGMTGAWSNEETGNSGKVVLVAIQTVNEVECRRLVHVINLKDRGDPFNFLVDRCFIDGEWRVYP